MSVKEDEIPDDLKAEALRQALRKLIEYAKKLEEAPEKEEDDLRDK
jgi:sulfur transfer protein SufE